MDDANTSTGNVPEENQIDIDPAREQCSNERGGPPAMSTPNRPPDPKRNRLNLSPIKPATVSSSLFSGAQSQTQESTARCHGKVQGSIVSESGPKRQKTGHAVDTNLGEVIIVWTFDFFFLLLNFLVLLMDIKFKNCPDRQNLSLPSAPS